MAETEDRVIRLASIVAIDIVGFSTMSEKDQRNAARKVEALRHRLDTVATKHGGRLFNTAGDGFMLEFGSAGSAFAAIQQVLDKRGPGEPPIRVGAHIGDVVVTATDDLLGHGVNVAARLQELAEPGTALVSAEFRSMARTSPTAAFLARGQQPLDNIAQRVQTFEILSSRQRFARLTQQVTRFGIAAAIVGVAVYFSPVAWRYAQAMLPQVMAQLQQAQSKSAPPPTTAQAPAPAPTPAATIEAAATPEVAATPAAPPAPTFIAGHTFADCEHCPEMIVVAAGQFEMGSAEGEPSRGRDEGPRHIVSLPPFAIGKYEVTFAQWDACLAGGGCNGYSPPDGGWGRGTRPVTNVSWADAQAYLEWLNQQAGAAHYRLASESEWEYAARAGATTVFVSGSRISSAQATFERQRTTPVGSHPANAFALFDMYGNVGEWVQDCYAPSYDHAPTDGAAVTPDRCARRVYRGGAFADHALALRAAARQSARPSQRAPGVGFRVVRTLD